MKLLGIVIGILLLLGLLYLLCIMPRMRHRPDITPFLGRLYAHRGLHDNESNAPENSMAAFAKAVDADYGIELDVQLTKDEVPVVFHDFNLKRICGRDQKVCELTYEELQTLQLCHSDQKIPTFGEVLELVNGKVPLIVEYKIELSNLRVCELGDELLSKYDGAYAIESFNPLGVLWYKHHRPEIFRGILSDNYLKDGMKDLPKVLYELLHHLMFNFLIKPDFVAYNCKFYKDHSRVLCRKLYRAPAVAWTIKSQQELNDRRDDYDLFIFDSFVPEA